MGLLSLLLFSCLSLTTALPLSRLRAFSNQISNPNLFMDPTFSVGGQGQSQTQDSSLMQTMALNIVQSQAQGNEVNRRQDQAGPPMGSQTVGQGSQNQGEKGVIHTQEQSQPGPPAQTATLTNGQPTGQGSKFQVPVDSTNEARLPQGPNTNNMANMNRPKQPIVGGTLTGSSVVSRTNSGIQQTVGGSNLFNPGQTNSILQAPPGTGRSQFNNNVGSENSMLNVFGGSGLSIDPSQFFKPKQNPDGSISGAAGNANGPPTMGPGFIQNPGGKTQNNDYNSMFGPPNFFMNPGASFGQ